MREGERERLDRGRHGEEDVSNHHVPKIHKIHTAYFVQTLSKQDLLSICKFKECCILSQGNFQRTISVLEIAL